MLKRRLLIEIQYISKYNFINNLVLQSLWNKERRVKRKFFFIENLFSIVYLVVITGFVFHTSPSQGYKLFSKYSMPYFIFLFFVILCGLIHILYFLNIKQWFRRDSAINMGKKIIRVKSQHKKITAIILLVSIFIIMEFYFENEEVYLKTRTFHPFLQSKLMPLDKSLHINRFGFRGDEIDKQKADNTIRIFFMGGSSIYGDRTEFEYTHARIFEKALQKRYPRRKIEVLNAGFHWYTTEHSLIDYLFKIREFKPDIIIIMHGINDLVRSFSPSRFAFGSYRDDYSHYYGAVSNLVFARRIFRIPCFISKFIQFFHNVFFSDFRDMSSLSALPLKEITVNDFPSLESFERNYNTFLDIVKADGVVLIVVTQPTLYKNNLDILERRKIVFPSFFCNIGQSKPSILSMEKGMGRFNSTLKMLAKIKSAYLIDLASVFPKNLDYFIDDCHYTKNGHSFIANVLFQFFIENDILGNFDSRK